jgi:hypothetical protein
MNACTWDDACTWEEDMDGNWFTGCGEAFTLTTGKPNDNGMKFCPFCSLPINAVDYEDWRNNR